MYAYARIFCPTISEQIVAATCTIPPRSVSIGEGLIAFKKYWKLLQMPSQMFIRNIFNMARIYTRVSIKKEKYFFSLLSKNLNDQRSWWWWAKKKREKYSKECKKRLRLFHSSRIFQKSEWFDRLFLPPRFSLSAGLTWIGRFICNEKKREK